MEQANLVNGIKPIIQAGLYIIYIKVIKELSIVLFYAQPGPYIAH